MGGITIEEETEDTGDPEEGRESEEEESHGCGFDYLDDDRCPCDGDEGGLSFDMIGDFFGGVDDTLEGHVFDKKQRKKKEESRKNKTKQRE